MWPIQRLRTNGIEICVQSFGNPSAHPILFIGGASAPMDRWDEALLETFAREGSYAIRYDHRDTGQSTSFPTGAPPYDFDDLVADALGILDALRIAKAHLCGVSMGGAIALRLAIDHPERVLSLGLFSTSTSAVPGNRADSDLPPVSPSFARYMQRLQLPDWHDRDSIVDYIIGAQRAASGTAGFDEARARVSALKIIERTSNVPSSLLNHWIMGPGRVDRARLNEITVPTLVFHGTDDPIFPLAHGRALASQIERASLIILSGVGHEMPPPIMWPLATEALLIQTRKGATVESSQA